MILLYICGTIILIGLIMAIIGKIFKLKKIKLTGILIIIVVIVGFTIFTAFEIEKDEVRNENRQISETSGILKVPDRIIYKNSNNQYYVLEHENSAFSTIYSEIFNRITENKNGVVLKEKEIDEIKEKESFVEFDYLSRSKNFIFPLQQENIAMIQMFTENGQVKQTKINDKDKLIKKIDKLTKKMNSYTFEKEQIYTSTNFLDSLPTTIRLLQKNAGVYQKVIITEKEYKDLLEETKFTTKEKLPEINFLNQKVIVTVTKYNTESVKVNIGNVKYKMAQIQDKYIVNFVVVSKIVNTDCVYIDFENKGQELIPNMQNDLNNTQTTTNTTASGILLNKGTDMIEIGYSTSYFTHIVIVNNKTEFIDYETNKKIKFSDLKTDECIYIEGINLNPDNDLKKIEATKIYVCNKQKVKKKVEKNLINTYRIDGFRIEYVDVNKNGDGKIVVTAQFEKFLYPIILNVNKQTECYLGMSRHLQSNYGYQLHEMCDITLDKKIVDIDNIEGIVKMIEYIAD